MLAIVDRGRHFRFSLGFQCADLVGSKQTVIVDVNRQHAVRIVPTCRPARCVRRRGPQILDIMLLIHPLQS